MISPGEPFHARDGVELWLQNFYLARQTGVALVGPHPTRTVPQIEWDEFIASTIRYADEVGARVRSDDPAGSLAYDILTLCRALCTVSSDSTCSKSDGAVWVRSRMPEWAWLIDAAGEARLSGGRSGLPEIAMTAATATFIPALREGIHAAARR